MFSREEIKSELYNRYILPTENKDKLYIGVEIEMPIVRLNNQPTDYELVQGAVHKAIEHFGFTPDKFDANNVCYSATRRDNGDNISFDCAYNNLELSMGKANTIHEINDRFIEYVTYINAELAKSDHILTGMGINPNYDINRKDFIPTGRYKMLESYLNKSTEWDIPMFFHKYSDFGSYASASQVQLDVTRDMLPEVIKIFSMIEPVKSVIFNNSIMDSEPNLLCVRDLFWENSTHGINPHNIGAFDCELDDVDDLLEYIMTTGIFCVEREGKYLFFKPIPIVDYFNLDEVTGEYFDGDSIKKYTFTPRLSDLEYLRTYKFEDLTYRGTIEYRSVCCQPLNEAMTVAAFHVGLMNNLDKLAELITNDKVLYHHGYSCNELRKIMNRRGWPEFIDREELRSLCVGVVELAIEGISSRGHNEEKYLYPLLERANTLTSPGRIYYDKLKAGVSKDDLVKEYSLG